MNNRPTLFLDIDGVLATTANFNTHPRYYHPVFKVYGFDRKCVNTINEIIEELDPVIILSSDWKNQHSINDINEIFAWRGVKGVVTDITPDFKLEYDTFQFRSERRSLEIITYVALNQITNFVAIDDLNLKNWIPERFVRCTEREGIKATGIKDKILKILKNE
jgi:hypothetical protein